MSRTSPSGTLAHHFARQVSFNRAILLLLLLLSAIMLVVELAYISPRIDALRSSVRAVRLGHVAMLNQETAVRGFILTREARFLEPYTAGRQDLTVQIDMLINALDGSPELAREVLAMRLAEETWMLQIAEPAIRTHSTDLDRSKALFDSYRSHQARLEQHLDLGLTALERSRRRTLLAGGVFQIAVFGLAMLISHRRLRRLQGEIIAPVAAVLDAVRSVGDGRLDPVNRQAGPSELMVIQAGLDVMITAIATERAAREARTREASERAAVLRQILDSAREFSGSLNLRYVLRTLGRSACSASAAPRALIWIFDEPGTSLDAVFDSDAHDDAPTALAPVEIGSGLVGRAARHARTVVPDAPTRVSAGAGPRTPDEMAIPLIVGARVVGVLHLLGGGVDRLLADRRDIVDILEMLASHGAAALESARLHEAVEERSHRDALTKLYNRRRLEEDLEAEIKRARRYQAALTFVMMDVDHFKRFNDSYGHAKGDEILEELAHVIQGTVRDTDTAYRFGGEEFSILLRETSLAGGTQFAERLCRRIEAHFQLSHPASPVTSSLGVACFSADMQTRSALIEAADAALYEAKRLGRNRVVAAKSSVAA